MVSVNEGDVVSPINKNKLVLLFLLSLMIYPFTYYKEILMPLGDIKYTEGTIESVKRYSSDTRVSYYFYINGKRIDGVEYIDIKKKEIFSIREGKRTDLIYYSDWWPGFLNYFDFLIHLNPDCKDKIMKMRTDEKNVRYKYGTFECEN